MNKMILVCAIVGSLILLIFLFVFMSTNETEVQVQYDTGEETCKQLKVLLNGVNSLPEIEYQKEAAKLEIISRTSEPAFIEAARAVASTIVPTTKLESFLMVSGRMINLCEKEGYWN